MGFYEHMTYDRLTEIIGKINYYRSKKDNNIFDDFYHADLDIMETLLEEKRNLFTETRVFDGKEIKLTEVYSDDELVLYSENLKKICSLDSIKSYDRLYVVTDNRVIPYGDWFHKKTKSKATCKSYMSASVMTDFDDLFEDVQNSSTDSAIPEDFEF